MNDSRIIDFRYGPENAQMCIGLVDDFYKSVVWDDGSLCFDYSADFDPWYFRRVDDRSYPVHSRRIMNRGFKYRYKPVITHRDHLLSISQVFDNPRDAISMTIEEYEASFLTYHTFAYQSEGGMRADIILYRLEARCNFATTRSSVVLNALGESSDGSHRIKVAVGIKTQKDSRIEDRHLAANEVKEGAFFIVHNGMLDDVNATLDYAKSALAWSRDYWNRFHPFRKGFEIPDPQIMDMLCACGRNIYQAREIENRIPVFKVGPTVYRGLWMVDGYFFLEAAQVMGNSRDAFDGLLSVLERVRPDGSIVEFDFHGK
jgi:hypothetical protein